VRGKKMILKKFVCGPLENNTYLIACENKKQALVIDPSFGSAKEILSFLEKNNLKLDKILLTHSHYDHIADVKSLKERLFSSIYVHKLDSKNLIDPGSDEIFSMFQIEKVVPDFYIKENDLIKLGDITFKVIETPGHTPGGVCYLIEKEKILFTGDTLFKGSYGRVDFPTSNKEDMIKSLLKLSKLDSKIIAYPGHGDKTTIKDESWLINAKKFVN
jgi:glyoxylase-like metal-dependent hydrolase (beta-lactamase superfamily II)